MIRTARAVPWVLVLLAAGCARPAETGREEAPAGTSAGPAVAPAGTTRSRATEPTARATDPKPPAPGDLKGTVAYLEGARVDKSRLVIFRIEDAAKAYYLATGDWPAKLDDLTRPLADGKPALLKPEDLTDPWGRRYEFRVDKQADAELVVVWSLGPTPADPNTHIYRTAAKP